MVIIPGAIFLFNSGDKANVVSNEKNNEKNDKYDESDVLAHFDKMYVKKMDDEWFYNFSIIYIPESKETRHFFNGCNLKYDHLDDYYVAVKDENGNVVDKWDFFPVLNISEKV